MVSPKVINAAETFAAPVTTEALDSMDTEELGDHFSFLNSATESIGKIKDADE